MFKQCFVPDGEGGGRDCKLIKIIRMMCRSLLCPAMGLLDDVNPHGCIWLAWPCFQIANACSQTLQFCLCV